MTQSVGKCNFALTWSVCRAGSNSSIYWSTCYLIIITPINYNPLTLQTQGEPDEDDCPDLQRQGHEERRPQER